MIGDIGGRSKKGGAREKEKMGRKNTEKETMALDSLTLVESTQLVQTSSANPRQGKFKGKNESVAPSYCCHAMPSYCQVKFIRNIFKEKLNIKRK